MAQIMERDNTRERGVAWKQTQKGSKGCLTQGGGPWVKQPSLVASREMPFKLQEAKWTAQWTEVFSLQFLDNTDK